jgi:F420-dependent oxidoreductase-like protein
MELRIFTEPQQGASYDDLLAVARATEELGFDAFFRSDHYLKMGTVSGQPGPTDAWLTLAALGRETSRIRLGTLVTAATFRYPGPLAISVAQADQMSGGRIELGLGAGWYEAEHQAGAMPFPGLGERFARLEEQLAIITGMWATADGQTFSFDGTHYQVNGSPGLPKPVQQPRVPIIVGGGGPRRTPRLAALYADEFNRAFVSVQDTEAQFGQVQTACEVDGRDPGSLVYSAAQTVCCGKTTEDRERRAGRIGRSLAELRQDALGGSPAEVADKIGQFAAAGATRMYLQVLDLADLDHLELIAAEVAPQLG